MSDTAQKPVSTLPKHIPWCYMLVQFMSAFSNTMPLTYLVFFITEYTGVSPMLMASVYTVARFADLGVSLFSGPIMQRQRRVRPYLLIIPLISGGGCILSFLNPDIPIGAKLVVLIFGYCCIHFPMNFSTVVGNMVMMKIAGANPANRVAITQSILRGNSSSRIAIAAITMPMLLYFLGRGWPGYFMVAILYFVVWMIANIILYIVSAPFEPKDAEAPLANVQRVTIAQMYKAAGSNQSILILLTCAIMAGIAAQVFSSGVLYYYRYSIGNMMWQASAGTIAGFVALGTSIICPPIARRIGKRNSLLFQYCWQSLMYLVIMLFADGNVILYIVVTSCITFGTAISTTWGINLWLDAAEIQLHETGVDNRPFLMSLNNIPIKLGFIASGPVVAFMLNNSGYEVTSAGVGTIANTQTFIYVWIGIVMALYVLAAVFFFFGYKANDKYAAECAASNAEKARERAAAAAAR